MASVLFAYPWLKFLILPAKRTSHAFNDPHMLNDAFGTLFPDENAIYFLGIASASVYLMDLYTQRLAWCVRRLRFTKYTAWRKKGLAIQALWITSN